MEAPIKEALRTLKFNDADTPVNANGIKQSTGYPDLGFTFNGLYVYVECKTFNKKNVSTTQRSFYLSPTEGFKVTKDAIHVVISIEVEREKYFTVKGQTFGVYLARKTEGQVGFQGLIEKLQNSVNDEGRIYVSQDDMARIKGYRNKYGDGGFQGRLIQIFGAHVDFNQ